MSHVAAVKTKVTDLEALKAACAELGFVFNANKKSYRWWGRWEDDSPIPEHLFTPAEAARIKAMSREERRKFMGAFLATCDHSISIPGADYEIALRTMEDGSYSLGFDWYQQEALLAAIGGPSAPKLVQGYAKQKLLSDAARYGHLLESEQRLEDGTIKVRLLASEY